jgi:hypothetical protein
MARPEGGRGKAEGLVHRSASPMAFLLPPFLVIPLSAGRRLRAAPTLRRRLHREAPGERLTQKPPRHGLSSSNPREGGRHTTPQSMPANDEV